MSYVLIAIVLSGIRAWGAPPPDTIHAKLIDGKLEIVGTTKPLPCAIAQTFATGERIECRSGDTLFELLHSFADPTGGAVIHTTEGHQKIRHFYRCDSREGGKALAETTCHLTPDRPADIQDQDLTSPIEASIATLGIPNAHQIDHEGLLFRSMEPRTTAQFDALAGFGIKEVVIFKNGPEPYIDAEIAQLKKRGIEPHHIAFPWKDYPSPAPECEQTLEALRLIEQARAHHRKILIHCTVGEDRTGYLAAIYRRLAEGADRRALFTEEMCERGYDMGDPYKPYQAVSLKIRDAITRLYLEMTDRIDEHRLSLARLDNGVCQTLKPPNPALLDEFQCHTSTRFRP